MSMIASCDAAVVGAGVLGLAHAYHLARRGLRVVVFEKNTKAQGASVRNFGMLWPIGQTPGTMHELALRSRALWLELLADSGLWHARTGSLHLAYRDDEFAVLQEFAREAPHAGFDCALWGAEQVVSRAPAVNPDGLLGALWSPTETCVDPREVIAGLPDYLAGHFGVEFVFGTTVTDWNAPTLLAGGREWQAERLFICPGDDLQTLFPSALPLAEITRCKLQMLRSEPMPADWKLGPMLAGGLTLRHYKSFYQCPSLPALKRRVAAEMPEFDRYGIHVMASQNGKNELILGDSHEYDAAIEPFDRSEIDTLILDYLRTFLRVPDLRIAARWHGIYAKHLSEPYVVAQPEPNVTIVTGVGGAGMTLSLGLAEQVVAGTLDGA